MMMSFGVSSWLVRHAKNLLDLGYTCMIQPNLYYTYKQTEKKVYT